VSHAAAWYEDQPFAIGDRVAVIDPHERAPLDEGAGRVVGYDAAGPRRSETFIRVLVLIDGLAGDIVALPPQALALEHSSERAGVAKTMLVELERSLRPPDFARLLDWLLGDACAQLIADPAIGRKNVHLGSLTLPGFLLHELRALAAEQRGISAPAPTTNNARAEVIERLKRMSR
jgi:hypothetical protein